MGAVMSVWPVVDGCGSGVGGDVDGFLEEVDDRVRNGTRASAGWSSSQKKL